MSFNTAALSSAASRLSARLQENLSESARDLGIQSLDGLASPSARHLESASLHTPEGIKETRRLLEGSPPRDADRIEGLRRVLALMAKGKPVAEFFPLVANCLSSSSLALRSLVAVYVVRLASAEADLALLAVNIYQKDLTDPNPLIRGMALRVLSSMGIDSISELVVLVLTKGSRDSNWYVRRTAALGIDKIYRVDPNHFDSLVGPLATLLNDRSAIVLGQAFSTFNNICPQRLDLLHPCFRTACRSLPDAQEWGQAAIVHALTRYVRQNFVDPNLSENDKLDPDLDLLFKQAEYLFSSRNPAVVMAVITLYSTCAPKDRLQSIVRPLLRILHSPPEISYMVLQDALVLISNFPNLFNAYVPEFFIRASDAEPVRQLKLQCLAHLVDVNNVDVVFKELVHYVMDSNEQFAGLAVKIIGECAQRQPQTADKCLQVLSYLSRSKSQQVVSQVIFALKSLFQHSDALSKLDPKLSTVFTTKRPRIIASLVQSLTSKDPKNRLTFPKARATVYFLVGEYAGYDGFLNSLGPDVLRYGAKKFAHESPIAKIQIVLLSAKLLTSTYLSQNAQYLRQARILFQYITNLARYDMDYHVRDRSRFIKGLILSGGVIHEAASYGNGEQYDSKSPLITSQQISKTLFSTNGNLIYQATLPTTPLSSLSTFSLALSGRKLQKSSFLPEWSTSPTDPSLRESSSQKTPPEEPKSLMKGFGSDTYGNRRSTSPAHVLTASSSRSGSETPPTSVTKVSGFRDLDDFLRSGEDDKVKIYGVSNARNQKSEESSEESESESESESEESSEEESVESEEDSEDESSDEDEELIHK